MKVLVSLAEAMYISWITHLKLAIRQFQSDLVFLGAHPEGILNLVKNGKGSQCPGSA